MPDSEDDAPVMDILREAITAWFGGDIRRALGPAVSRSDFEYNVDDCAGQICEILKMHGALNLNAFAERLDECPPRRTGATGIRWMTSHPVMSGGGPAGSDSHDPYRGDMSSDLLHPQMRWAPRLLPGEGLPRRRRRASLNALRSLIHWQWSAVFKRKGAQITQS